MHKEIAKCQDLFKNHTCKLLTSGGRCTPQTKASVVVTY